MDNKNWELLSPKEIENIRVEKLKALDAESQACATVELAYLEISKKILEHQEAVGYLRTQKKDLEIALSKGKTNIRSLKNEIEVLKALFWKNKN